MYRFSFHMASTKDNLWEKMANKGLVNITACILVILLELIHIVVSVGPVCYTCNNIPHPRDCGRIVQCGDSERCYVESFVTDSGGIFFNSGCSANFKCPASQGKREINMTTFTNQATVTKTPSFSPKYSPQASNNNTILPLNNTEVEPEDVQVCYECCDNTDYCNREMCDRSVAPPSNGTFCLNCPDVLKPTDCEFVTQCGDNDVCYTERIFINGELRYRLGCINKNSCVAPIPQTAGKKKRFLLEPDLQLQDYCAKCCTNGLGNCNRDLCDPLGRQLPTGTEELILVTPPVRTDYCQDLTPTSCKLLGLQNNKFCLSQSVKNYACREFCGTCVNTGHLTPAPTLSSSVTSTTPPSSGSKDCFFKSQKYKGQTSVSRTNKQCQQWSTKLQPNAAMASNFPDRSIADAKNFCRDPDGKGHPWCFVSVLADDQGWEFCNVKYCAECYFPGNSLRYNGYVDTTGPNKHCQPWSSFKLHPIPLRDSMFPAGDISLSGSYCRDPLGSGHPECYQNNQRTDCNIPTCTGACVDDPNTNCQALSSIICKDEYYRTLLCAKTCNNCGFGLLPPVYKEPPKDICSDNPDANCATLKLLICTDPDSARKFCPRTCNACGFLNLSTPPSTAPPPPEGTTPPSITLSQGTDKPVLGTSTTKPTQQVTPPFPVWSIWGRWQCMEVKGACVMLRYRTCSTGNTKDCPGKNYNINPCDKTLCPSFFTQTTTQSTTTVKVSQSTTTLPVTQSTTSLPTTTEANCFDAKGCSNPDLSSIVCDDRDLAIHICPKKCNLCDQCRDAPGLNCSSPSIQKLFCPDKTMSVQYCQQTCHKCNEKPIPITRNKCGDPVANEFICSFLDQEICLCNDDDLRPFLCQNYCDGRCGTKAPSPTTCTLTR